MSSAQPTVIATIDALKFHDDGIDVDANGDPMSATSSSEEDIASCSSNTDENDDVIQLKTR